jgi:hypothetical protein
MKKVHYTHYRLHTTDRIYEYLDQIHPEQVHS